MIAIAVLDNYFPLQTDIVCLKSLKTLTTLSLSRIGGNHFFQPQHEETSFQETSKKTP